MKRDALKMRDDGPFVFAQVGENLIIDQLTKCCSRRFFCTKEDFFFRLGSMSDGIASTEELSCKANFLQAPP